MGVQAKPLQQRIYESIVVDPNGCWLWTKFKQYGYGKMAVGSRRLGTYRVAPAHRVSYEAFIGPIPAGRQLDHLCRVTACVNPEHLEPVTPQLNSRRRTAHRLGITVCARGHEQTPQTTYYKKGRAACGPCDGRLGQ